MHPMHPIVSHAFISLLLLFFAYRTGVINERDNPGDLDGFSPWTLTRHEWKANGLLLLIFLSMLYMDMALWGNGLTRGAGG